MNAGTFEAAPWGNCTLFSRRQTLLNRVWNSSEGITFSYSYEPGMKMRLIIFQAQLFHPSVKCVFDLISLPTHQIWLQMTFGCFRKKKTNKQTNKRHCSQEIKTWGLEGYSERMTHRFQKPLTKTRWMGTAVLDTVVKLQPLNGQR